MLKILFSICTLVVLSGCASVANFYDRRDPCQTGSSSEAERQRLGRPQGYTAPSFCGASSNRTYIYSPGGERLGYIAK